MSQGSLNLKRKKDAWKPGGRKGERGCEARGGCEARVRINAMTRMRTISVFSSLLYEKLMNIYITLTFQKINGRQMNTFSCSMQSHGG